MVKVFLYGVMSEYNFGGPSLMHGVREIVKTLHDNYEIVCYQRTKIVDIAISGMEFPVLQDPYTKPMRMLLDGIKTKIGYNSKQKDRAVFWNHLMDADIVANLVGICFCSNFRSGKYSYVQAIKRTVGTFLISALAKYLFGKKTVKCTSSYGPVVSKNDLVSARFSAKYIFDVMCAREVESERQMREVAGITKTILVSPDIANLMPYKPSCNRITTCVGISVSHQVIKQWKSDAPYITCVAKLTDHILSTIQCQVVLIPNEVSPACKYNDAHVADDILHELGHNRNISVFDVAQMSSSQLKSQIGQCEVLIASRYHSCVAALSAGVPTLVVGWHHKYDELLSLYNQNQWVMASKDCTVESLITRFDQLWEKRFIERAIIATKREEVRQQVMKAGKMMFQK